MLGAAVLQSTKQVHNAYAGIVLSLKSAVQEIEATLMQSAQSTEGLIEAARIVSTLKMANSQAQSSPGHASNAAFAEGIAQHAQQRVQDTSDRHQEHMEAGTGSDRQNAGNFTSPKVLHAAQELLQTWH